MHPSREFWQCYEPLNAVAFFHPAFREDLEERGLTGGWNAYFARRSAPLGRVPAPVVTALFHGWAPMRVERSLPEAWESIEPAAVIESTLATAAAVLESATATVSSEQRAAAVTALEQAVDHADYGGRALGAAWASVARPDDELARLWLAAATLREHRGDGHVIAAATAGLSGLQTVITHVAAGAVQRDLVQRSRGWTDTQWDVGVEDLAERGILSGDGSLSEQGRALRERIEAVTDRLAEPTLSALGENAAQVIETLRTMSRDVIDRGDVVVPNPMGLTRP